MEEVDDVIVLNVGGKVFCTSVESLGRLPDTKLGRLAGAGILRRPKEVFFDRNPKVMHGVLDLYRTGELHLPSNLCSSLIRKELEFWEVPEVLISECCWKTYQNNVASNRIIEHIHASLSDPYGLDGKDHTNLPLATRVWLGMERSQPSLVSKLWHVTYVMFMMLSIVIFALETVDMFRGPPHDLAQNVSCLTKEQLELFSEPLKALHYLDISCTIFFTIEPLVRLATCPRKAIFLTIPLNIIDLVLIISMWVGLVLEDFIVPTVRDASHGHLYLILTMRAVLAFRVVRVLHLTKHIKSMKLMMLSMKASSHTLGLLMTVLFIAVVLYGNLVYIAEFISETHVFENVPLAAWWALITLTTVGYGDFYPTSVVGYFIGSACAITGLLLLAMPIAIIATNFSAYTDNMASYVQRNKRSAFIKNVLGRDSVVTKSPPLCPLVTCTKHSCLELPCGRHKEGDAEEKDTPPDKSTVKSLKGKTTPPDKATPPNSTTLLVQATSLVEATPPDMATPLSSHTSSSEIDRREGDILVDGQVLSSTNHFPATREVGTNTRNRRSDRTNRHRPRSNTRTGWQ